MFDRTRRIQRIEASIFEAALCFTETGAVGTAALGYEVKRLGVNRFSPTCPATSTAPPMATSASPP
ncbi:MAG: hypothetical protein WDM85_00890 [Caulobacteraceae bacterium]